MNAKPIAAAALLALIAAPALSGQDTLTLNDLRTPLSPAFVILGVEPTSVDRPSTPRAFALGLLSASGGEGGVIPENYAAEVAPYWMRRHPGLTFEEYIDPGLWGSLLQTLSFSLATTTLTEGADSTAAVGVGFRVMPIVGRPPSKLLALVASLDAFQTRRLNLIEARADARTPTDLVKAVVRLGKNGAMGRAVSREIRDFPDDERVGLHLQFAGALAGHYPGNEFSAGTVGRTGLWSTLSYRTESPRLDLMGLVRWLRDETEAEQSAVDFGVRGVFTINRFSASAELVQRSAGDSDAAPATAGGFGDGRRVVGLLEYRASDDMYFTFSYGQDFADVEGREPLVAILGGQLHFGPKPAIPIPQP